MRSRYRVRRPPWKGLIASVSATTIATFTLLALRGVPIVEQIEFVTVLGIGFGAPMVALLALLVASAAKVWEPKIQFWPRFLRAFAVGYPLVFFLVLLWLDGNTSY
jgi:hypothetical protein